MRDFMWKVCNSLLVVIMWMLLVSTVLVVILEVEYFVGKHSCTEYSETTGRETKYASQVCYVKDETNNKWYSMNEFLARQGIIKTQ